MFGKLDQHIEKSLKKYLHKKRSKIIAKTLADYVEKNHPSPDILAQLKKLLDMEADRIYSIVDESILKERVKRAKYTFWITAITSTIISAVIIALTNGLLAPLIIPLLTTFIAWAVSLATIPLSYNQRIEGAMQSTVQTFEKQLQEEAVTKNVNVNVQIDLLKKQLNEISAKIDLLTRTELSEDGCIPQQIQKEKLTFSLENGPPVNHQHKKHFSHIRNFHMWNKNKMPYDQPLPEFEPIRVNLII